MLRNQAERIQVVKGTCVGVETSNVEDGLQQITAVRYSENSDGGEVKELAADATALTYGRVMSRTANRGYSTGPLTLPYSLLIERFV